MKYNFPYLLVLGCLFVLVFPRFAIAILRLNGRNRIIAITANSLAVQCDATHNREYYKSERNHWKTEHSWMN